MGRRTLLLIALLLPIGAFAAVSWILSPRLHQRPLPPPAAGRTSRPASAAPPSAPVVDPGLPLYRGATRRLAAEAVDATAASRFDAALVLLAREFMGLPIQDRAAPEPGPERLRLDLSGFQDLTYVEQVLALANSRRVRSQTEAVDVFSNHVRWLRYDGGQVSACRRHRGGIAWAAAAERRGYLVNLSPFLPGSRQRKLSLPSAEATRPGRPRGCRRQALPQRQAYIPLAALGGVMASLRSGDLALLVARDPRREAMEMVLIEMQAGRATALGVPTGGVIGRDPDLVRFAGRNPEALGLVLLRPIPNADGRPDP